MAYFIFSKDLVAGILNVGLTNSHILWVYSRGRHCILRESSEQFLEETAEYLNFDRM